MTPPTLDQRAAQYAQRIVKNARDEQQQARLDVFVTKTLSVLQEQGVYACMLFLYSRSDTEKPQARIVREQLREMLQMLQDDYGVQWRDERGENLSVPADAENDRTSGKVLDFYANVVASDLDTLLLVRDLYEQTLIYARYGAKAAGG